MNMRDDVVVCEMINTTSLFFISIISLFIASSSLLWDVAVAMYEPMNTLLFRAISSQAEGQYQSSANSVLVKQEMFAQKHKVVTGKLLLVFFEPICRVLLCTLQPYYNQIALKLYSWPFLFHQIEYDCEAEALQSNAL